MQINLSVDEVLPALKKMPDGYKYDLEKGLIHLNEMVTIERGEQQWNINGQVLADEDLPKKITTKS